MLNRVELIGNVGKDPEFKQVSDKFSTCKTSLATTEYFTKDGKKEQATTFEL